MKTRDIKEHPGQREEARVGATSVGSLPGWLRQISLCKAPSLQRTKSLRRRRRGLCQARSDFPLAGKRPTSCGIV
jgi:hypothetical protein